VDIVKTKAGQYEVYRKVQIFIRSTNMYLYRGTT